jgi:hypothetical protein
MVLVMWLVVGVAACGSQPIEPSPVAVDQGVEIEVPGGVLRADLTEVLSGRRMPSVALSGANVVVYGETDHSMGWQETVVAVSTDEGRSFRSVDIGASLFQAAATVDGDIVTLVGRRCDPPDDVELQACAEGEMDLQGMRFDIDDPTSVTGLPGLDELGEVAPSPIGSTKGTAMFELTTRTGAKELLAIDRAGTPRTEPIPGNLKKVCAVEGALIGVGPGSTTEDIVPTKVGEPLFFATESTDGGVTWSTPLVFATEQPGSYSFDVRVACGPAGVVAWSAEMAVFRPRADQWITVRDLPADELRATGPVVWTDPDTLIAWATPRELGEEPPTQDDESPNEGTQRVTRIELAAGDGAASVSEPKDAAGLQVVGAGRGSAEAHGIFLAIETNGSDTYLGIAE